MKYFLFFIAVFFVGCQQGSSPSSQTLRVNITADPQTLDPRKARDLTGSTLMRMLFEGLTRVSKTGQVEMALAKSVDLSQDGRIYTFHLRKSEWSNGDPVTASDFLASWASILDPSFPTDVAYQLYGIKNARQIKMGELHVQEIGVQAPDEQTLVVELEHPIPYFLEMVSMNCFFPVHRKTVEKQKDWALNPATYIGNGPFYLSHWDHSDQIRLKKNSRYWQADEVKLKEIDLCMLANDTEVRLFEEKKLDWAGSPLSSLPADAIASMKEEKKMHVNPFLGTAFFRINTASVLRDKKNPLSHPSFRKALAVAIDRAAITEHLLQGGQTPARSLVPPGMGLSQNGYFSDGDPQKAHSLFVDALLALDLSMDKLEPITLSYLNNDRNASVAQIVQKQWESALGIQVLLEAVEPKIFFQRVSKKEYQIAAGSWTADFNDPVNFLEVFQYRDASTNNTHWESAKYIDLLNRSALCKGVEERRELLREAEQLLMEQMPIIPMYHFALNYLQQEGLEGVALSPTGQIDFRWASLR